MNDLSQTTCLTPINSTTCILKRKIMKSFSPALELNPGEEYLFSLSFPDGKTIHTILLPADHDDTTWDESMEWAKSIGGDLPDRVELALLFKYKPEAFKKDYYWSNSQHASFASVAWYQSFYNGFQVNHHTNTKLRARAVRRVTI